jgi:lipopolysaccharide/colanic/teichoic acid biosynthesis glycosyltransferase
MKRGFDVVVSACLLVVALPVLLVAAALVRLTSPGPALFRQFRMGKGFRPFQILKLRTMGHARAGLAYTLGPDPRITRLGRWLRRTKIDELPQLWNVLRGEMSLVGPRPVLPELTTEFREHYARLLEGRPGLTDPASLKYCQEAAILAEAEDPMLYFKSVVTPDKIRISLECAERANLWTDALTIAMTAVICCVPAMSRCYGRVKSPAAQETEREVAALQPVTAHPAKVQPVGAPLAEAAAKPVWKPLGELEPRHARIADLAWNRLPRAVWRHPSTGNEHAGGGLHL